MPYYRGDYIRGGRSGYYRGDPFLGALIGSAAKALGVGKIVSKGAAWLGSKITGSAVKKAAVATAGAIAAPVLYNAATSALPVSQSLPPLQIGQVGINPMNALPGGEPFITYGRRKYRRMNPLNPKALKRAIRRADGFEKFAKSVMSSFHTGPRKYKTTRRRK